MLFKRNEKKNCKGTITPKTSYTPDSRVARLSISIQYWNTFRGIIITNFISNSSEFVQLLIGEKIVSTETLSKVLSIIDLFLDVPPVNFLLFRIDFDFVSSIILHHHWKLISIWKKPYVLLQLHEITAFSITKYLFHIQACNHKGILIIFVRFWWKMHAHAFSVFTKPYET